MKLTFDKFGSAFPCICCCFIWIGTGSRECLHLCGERLNGCTYLLYRTCRPQSWMNQRRYPCGKMDTTFLRRSGITFQSTSYRSHHCLLPPILAPMSQEVMKSYIIRNTHTCSHASTIIDAKRISATSTEAAT